MSPTDIRTALAEQRKVRERGSWLNIIKQTASEWMDDDCMTWAAAVACYALLALAPLLVIAIKVGTVVLRGKANDVSSAVVQSMGTAAAGDAIREIIQKIEHHGGGIIASAISAVLTVLGVGGVFAELQQAMNRIWKLKPKPGKALSGFLRARLKSVVVMAVAALLLLASVVVATWLGHLTKSIGPGLKYVTWVIDVAVSVGVLTLLFALVYKTVPDAEISWRSTAAGALISAILFEVGKYGVALYFRFAAPTSAFGAVGSLAAVLIWIYYSAQIVFFGAEFTQVYAKSRGHGVRPSRYALVLSKCDETETPTPSAAPPSQKPQRPAKPRPAPDPYAVVLGRHVPAGAAQFATLRPEVCAQIEQRQQLIRNYLVAGAGLTLGALIGSYGALTARRTPIRRAKDTSAARLNTRIDGARRKLLEVSRAKQFLERGDVAERLDALERQVQQVGAKTQAHRRRARDGSWTGRVARTVKSYF